MKIVLEFCLFFFGYVNCLNTNPQSPGFSLHRFYIRLGSSVINEDSNNRDNNQENEDNIHIFSIDEMRQRPQKCMGIVYCDYHVKNELNRTYCSAFVAQDDRLMVTAGHCLFDMLERCNLTETFYFQLGHHPNKSNEGTKIYEVKNMSYSPLWSAFHDYGFGAIVEHTNCKLNFLYKNSLVIPDGTAVDSYGYPLKTNEYPAVAHSTYNGTGKWGNIRIFSATTKDGDILGDGASGGPIIWHNCSNPSCSTPVVVIGINSYSDVIDNVTLMKSPKIHGGLVAKAFRKDMLTYIRQIIYRNGISITLEEMFQQPAKCIGTISCSYQVNDTEKTIRCTGFVAENHKLIVGAASCLKDMTNNCDIYDISFRQGYHPNLTVDDIVVSKVQDIKFSDQDQSVFGYDDNWALGKLSWPADCSLKFLYDDNVFIPKHRSIWSYGYPVLPNDEIDPRNMELGYLANPKDNKTFAALGGSLAIGAPIIWLRYQNTTEPLVIGIQTGTKNRSKIPIDNTPVLYTMAAKLHAGPMGKKFHDFKNNYIRTVIEHSDN